MLTNMVQLKRLGDMVFIEIQSMIGGERLSPRNLVQAAKCRGKLSQKLKLLFYN